MIRNGLNEAENSNASGKSRVLNQVAASLSNSAASSSNSDKVMELARIIRDLSSAS